MNMEALYSCVSHNQRKMIDTLMEHPEGLRSDELAEITGVSNKSGTLTPDVRELLLEHGLQLSIRREKGKAKWVIKSVPKEITLNRKKLSQIESAIHQLSVACEQIKILLNAKG